MKVSHPGAAVVLLLASVAFAEEDSRTARDEGCKDSSLINRFPGSRIEECYHYVWSEHVFQSGPKEKPTPLIVGGGYEQIVYAMDPKQSGLEVLRNFENALKKAGFTIDHTSGSEASRALTAHKEEGSGKLYVGFQTREINGRVWVPLTILKESPMPMRLSKTGGPPPGKEDLERCPEPKSLPRMAGALIRSCKHSAFDEAEVIVSADGGKAKLEGEVFKIVYRNDPTTSPCELARTYEAWLKQQGFQVVAQSGKPNDFAHAERGYELTGHKEKGQRVNVSLETDFDVGYLQLKALVVEGKAMEQQLEVSAASLLADLRQNGRVAVYGINFDTNKATITSDSEKVLTEVQKLLAENKDLKLKIEGHTDNVGKPAMNLALSKQRAAAVKSWLAKKNIQGSRLATDGLGDTKPVADNQDEQGRAKNRRVELVRQD